MYIFVRQLYSVWYALGLLLLEVLYGWMDREQLAVLVYARGKNIRFNIRIFFRNKNGLNVQAKQNWLNTSAYKNCTLSAIHPLGARFIVEP